MLFKSEPVKPVTVNIKNQMNQQNLQLYLQKS